MANIDIADLGFRLQEEIQDVARIVQEKGVKAFQVPFGIAFAALVGSYMLVYRSTANRVHELNAQIEEQRTREKAASTYDGLRTQLLGYYAKMPRPEKKEGWLFDRILQLASAQGIVLDNIGGQVEESDKDFSLVSIEVSSRMSYAQLGKFLETLENQKPVLLVTGVNMEREKKPSADGKPGPNSVKLTISTIFPKAVRTL